MKNSWILSSIKAWIGNNRRPYSSFSYHLHHVIIFIVIIIYYSCFYVPSFPVAQLVKNPPVIWETWVQSLGEEDPLEKEMKTHSSILACRIPWMEEPGRLQSTGSQSWTQLSNFTFTFMFQGLDQLIPFHLYNYTIIRHCPPFSDEETELKFPKTTQLVSGKVKRCQTATNPNFSKSIFVYYMKWSEVAQSCLTFCNPPWTVAYHAPPCSSVHGMENVYF